jgi:hypothetical protein
MTPLGYIMIVFVVLALVMLALPWIPFMSAIIGQTIGGLICILPLPTIIIALVFNLLDDKKRDEEALKIARQNYKIQYDQWARQNYQNTKNSARYNAQNIPVKTHSNTIQKKRKEPSKKAPPPPPPPPPE